MLITLIEVENYKRIKKVVIGPGERNMILIAGKNRQGKSSLIGAMSAALGGGKEAADEPIRKGQKSADIKIELDNGALVVHRRFLKSGSSRLEVTNKEGKLSSPQAILDRIVGTRFLDPLRFSRLSEKAQREVLLGCVDLGLDLEVHATKRKKAYSDRADSNRSVKRLKAELDIIPRPEPIPDQVSAEEMIAELERLTEQDAARVSALHNLEEMRAEGRLKKAAIHEAEKRGISVGQDLEDMKTRHTAERAIMKQRQESDLELAQKKADEVAADGVATSRDYDDFVEEGKAVAEKAEELSKLDLSDEIEAAKTSIREASSKNEERAKLLATNEKHVGATAALEKEEAEADSYTILIEELDQEKASALAAASMPIEGLDIDEERVLYDNVPLSQASGAEQLQVSLAIAASLSPELRDIWVEDGSLLDQDSLKLVHEFAKKNDLRIWLERVGESDDDCVIIEEGVVKT